MRNFYCVNFEGNPADLRIRDCIITGARWLRKNKKSEVVISDRENGLRVVVKTDFRACSLGEVSGFLFHADYAHDRTKGVMHMLLTSSVLDEPEDEDEILFLAEHYVRSGGETRSKKRVPAPSQN